MSQKPSRPGPPHRTIWDTPRYKWDTVGGDGGHRDRGAEGLADSFSAARGAADGWP